MAPEVDPAQESIVLASFENHHAAEQMVAALGRGFRKKARKRKVSAFVVRGNKDGSLKLTQSRVLTVRGIEAAFIHISLSLAVGFLGLVSWLKGGWRFAHSVHVHKVTLGRTSRRLMRCSPALVRRERSY